MMATLLVAPRITSPACCSRVQWAWRASPSRPFASSLALPLERSNPGAVDPSASTFGQPRTPPRLSTRHGGCFCRDDPGAWQRPYSAISIRYYSASLPAKDAATVENQSPGGTTPADKAATTRRRRRIAIVGAGPSGCYAAKYLHSGLWKHSVSCSIDVIDQQCVLGGLVRFGVAPDHPEVKNVLNDFEALFEGHPPGADPASSAFSSSIQFYGGVKVGRDVQLAELRSMYDAVVLAYGCESSQAVGIPGELEMTGVLSAREFVAWYNGTWL
jgi:Pyridine nucleotide-disulphide oxidoreductase